MKKLLLVPAIIAGLIMGSGLPAADFNGDGINDIGVFRPSSGLWSVRNITRVYFGGSSDQACPGDYDGDGNVDIAVFRPGTGLWAVRNITRTYYGAAFDQPLPGVMGAGGGGGGQWTRNVNDIYYNSGNVGIGVNDPGSYRLQVTGPSDNILPLRITNNDAGTSLYLGFGNTTGPTYAQIYSSGQDLVLQRPSGNRVGIGTTDPGWTLEVSGPVMLEDTTTPVAFQSWHSGIYSANGDLYAYNDTGVATRISPHDKETGEWIFYSKNIKTGRVVRVDMERMVRAIEELTGEQFMVEKWEKPMEE